MSKMTLYVKNDTWYDKNLKKYATRQKEQLSPTILPKNVVKRVKIT